MKHIWKNTQETVLGSLFFFLIFSFSYSFFFFQFIFWPYHINMWDLSSSTRDWTPSSLYWKFRVLTAGLPGKSPNCAFLNGCFKRGKSGGRGERSAHFWNLYIVHTSTIQGIDKPEERTGKKTAFSAWGPVMLRAVGHHALSRSPLENHVPTLGL